MDFLEETPSITFLSDEPVTKIPHDGQIVSQEKRIEDRITVSELPPAEQADVTGFVQKALDDRLDLQGVEKAWEKDLAVQEILFDAQRFTSVERALVDNPDISSVVLRTESRANRAREVFLNLGEEFTGGKADAVLEVLDSIAYDIWSGYRNIPQGFRGEGTSQTELIDLWQVALSSYEPAEFDRFLKERIDGARNASGDDAWVIYRELDAMEKAGIDIWDRELGIVNSALATVDLATLGLAGTTAGFRVGRSAIARLRATAGTRVASEAASGTSLVVRPSGVDGEVLDPILAIDNAAQPSTRRPSPRQGFTVQRDIEDAIILDDIAPSAARSRSYTPTSPVSQGYIGQAMYDNRFVQAFLARGYGLGTAKLSDMSESWIRQRAAELAEVNSTRLIDFDVEFSDLEQGKVTYRFGKTDKLPYTDVISAQKVAEGIPNAKVTAVGTRGWAVEVQQLIPTRDIVSPLDLSQVTEVGALSKIFGSAGRGSSSWMSNLADAGDFAARGVATNARQTLKEINKLPKRDRVALDKIIRSLRDNPLGGTAREWIGNREFTDAFHQITGEWPSRKVLEAYERTVELSDFSWYIQANERLRSLANVRALVYRKGDKDAFVFETKHTVASLKAKSNVVSPIWVWDAARGQRVNVTSLSDEVQIMAFGERQSDFTDYIANHIGQTKVPTLQDAMPYNPGGPRFNRELQYFVGNNNGRWATALGTRTEKLGNKARDQWNTVAAAFRSNSPDIDRIIKENNEWNPNLENAEDWRKFAERRGLKVEEDLIVRARGAKVADSDLLPNIADVTLKELTLDQYISYKRHDIPLIEFGGELTENPDPVLSIMMQWNHMVNRGAQTQYRIQHPTAWVKKATEMGIIDRPLVPMTDEQVVKTATITDNTEAARKLKQEQAVIIRRLNMLEGSVSWSTANLAASLDKATGVWLEKAYGLEGPLGKASYSTARFIKENLTDNLSNKLLSLGFWLRMASPDQAIIQSSHGLTIATAVSLAHPTKMNGFKALSFASFARNAAREGSLDVWDDLGRNMAKKLGLDDAKWEALTDHMFKSGRGYMRGAIAEDPYAGVGNSALSVAKDIASAPYYTGENFSATVTRVIAFLDEAENFTDYDSPAFWDAVARRDRALSFSLNNAQRSFLQSDPALSVVTQWSSYPLRQMEMPFSKELSKTERGTLAAMMTIFWGAGGMGAYHVMPDSWFAEDKGVMASVIVDGFDTVIESFTGVKIGDRIAFNPFELIDRATNPLNTTPALSLVTGLSGDTWKFMRDIVTGNFSLLAHDAATITRNLKLIDNGFLAYSMMMEDARISRTGSSIEGPFTPAQEMLQLIGIKPAEAVDTSRIKNLVFKEKLRYKKAVDNASVPFKLMLRKSQEGNHAAAQRYLQDVDVILSGWGLSPMRRKEALAEIANRAGMSETSWLTLESIKDDHSQAALDFQRRMEAR